ncbi:MAG: hypothetical protein QW814_02435 [Methanothrix sp.]
MNEKTLKFDHASEQKYTDKDVKNSEQKATTQPYAKPTAKTKIIGALSSFLRKDNSVSESRAYAGQSGINYNFIPKHSDAIRAATSIAVTASMGGMLVVFSSGVLLDSMKLAYSSLYFATAGMASALLLAANALYNKRANQK